MSVRRSARIAAMYGALYSNIPSVTAQKRIKQERNASLAEALKKKHDEMKKEQTRQDGPLACRVMWYNADYYDVSFNNPDGWAAKRYTPSLVPGITYDVVWVQIDREDHSGYCSDADEMYVTRNTIPLYFQRLDGETPLMDMIPSSCQWKHIAENHYWCNAHDRYTVVGVESIIAPHKCYCESCC